MTGEIRSLTGLRGIAAVVVMIDHYMAVDFSSRFPWTLLPHGYLAVDMFMILSGFVLAMSYQERFERLGARAASVLFFKHRVARLYPVYLCMTLVCFVLGRGGWLTFFSPDTSVAALVTNALAVQTWIWPGSSLDVPGWSISAEWAANLLFPLLVPVMLSRSPVQATVAAGLGVFALLVSSMLFGNLFGEPVSGVVNVINGPGALGRCVGEFVLGMYLWRWRSRGYLAGTVARNVVQAGILVAMAGLILDPRLDVGFVLLSAMLVYALSYGGSVTSRVLGWSVVHGLGAISYSIYLVHIALLPVRDGLALVFARAALPHSWILAVWCTAGLALGLATLSYKLVEQPAKRWLNRALNADEGAIGSGVVRPSTTG